MSYEVEQKFRVADFAAIEVALASLAATIHSAVSQADLYFSHPSRDFSQTDEALRIRRIGESNFITYKGPKIDATTKVRREIELRLSEGPQFFEDFGGLLTALGFSPVAEVRKQRRSATVQWQGREMEVALDEVQNLGRFVELEVLAEQAEIEAAKSLIQTLAAHLGLGEIQRRTYLEMLLAQRLPRVVNDEL